MRRVLLLPLVLLVACSGGDDGGADSEVVTREDLKEALVDVEYGGLSEVTATCVVDAVFNKLTDDQARLIAQRSEELSDDTNRLMADAQTGCMIN